jgi:predicted nucleic acid-binding protein
MMLYLDSSALVKCYGEESGALDTVDVIDRAEMVATSPITRVEVSSALARAVREGILAPKTGREAYESFRDEWRSLIQVPLTERVLSRAQGLLWESGLRAYDAVQLASAMVWQERVAEDVTLATFDTRLASAAVRAGLHAWPRAS